MEGMKRNYEKAKDENFDILFILQYYMKSLRPNERLTQKKEIKHINA